MAEYIERSYIRKMAMLEMAYTMETETDAAVVLRMIDDAPAADVAPVVHGRWNGWHGDKMVAADEYRHYHYYSCNKCGIKSAVASNYCPSCGAKMDGAT